MPINDAIAKDVIVTWKLYNGFDSGGTFWTDSNGMGMMERHLNKRTGYDFNGHDNSLARNYFPIDSAVAVRDGNL